ncbi:sensor histidine kinase [Clostridium ganghwense]|uniref:histidine kinase n=1 Tax=Clostridium ganghwense TaxID=312089 RepID=A0ABT4CKS9_9CLOT|nr:sensor histidine kinase [Clostridium ganghwense]MCY6369651.1 sensor histidine kinase [Clostridium ganghwense]
MKGWLILSKFFIVIYVAVISTEMNILNVATIVLFLLCYLALNILIYIIKDKKMIKIIAAISLAALLIGVQWVNSVFILLLPINLFEVIYLNKMKQWIGASLAAFPLFLLQNIILKEYLVVAMLSYVICNICYMYKIKIKKLTYENDSLKEKNYLLNKNLIKDIEYESQIKYMSQLEERNKIAQEIHDNIGHTISGSLMQLEAAKIIMQKDKEKSRKMLQNTIDVLREGMENIRATLRNVKPPSEQLGINKLKLILKQYEINSEIKANLYYDGELKEISHTQWKVINESVKEALTNTMKYAKASEIKVKIQTLNKLIKVEIKDNGIGSLKINKGLGMRGIEERCENINGKVIVDGSNGFSVILLLPIE